MNQNGIRLLIVCGNFAPELTGIGKYVSEMTTALALKGVVIRVVTAPPYYPAWKVQAGYSAWRYSRERLAGAEVIRCPLWIPRYPGGLSRVVHALSFALSTFPAMIWQAITWRPDAIMVIEPPLACAPGARIAAFLCGARTWLHVQDFEVDAAFALGLLKGGLWRRVAVGIESRLMRGFARVSSISPRMLRKLHDKKVEQHRIGYLPNWVDTSLIRPLEGENPLRRILGLPVACPVFLYSGNLGEKQGLELIVGVAREYATTGTPGLFIICGEGAAKGRIQTLAAGLANVRFLPLQPLKHLNELLNLADVHLLPQRADAEDLVMPSKLTAILASGRPVVASARPGSDVAEAAGAGGLVVAPGEIDAFSAALRRLIADPELRRAQGESGRRYALEHWDRDAVMEQALGALKALLAQK